MVVSARRPVAATLVREGKLIASVAALFGHYYIHFLTI
jgi:hypothetical protein